LADRVTHIRVAYVDSSRGRARPGRAERGLSRETGSNDYGSGGKGGE
jgi:hypothetical protein